MIAKVKRDLKIGFSVLLVAVIMLLNKKKL
jgi:hypothetical protein